MATVFDLVSNLSHQSLQLALNGIWLGVGLSGLAWLLMRHIRGITAATRYTAWWIVLIVTLALPLLMTSPLELWQHNPVDGASSGTTAAYESAETPAGGADAATLHRLHPDRAFELPAVNTSHSSSARQSGNENAIGSMVFRLMPVSLAVIWLAGVLVLGIRLWRAYRELISIKSDSRPLDISRLPRVRAMMERNLHRHVRIGISGKVTSPIAAGLGRPMILIPPRVVEELSEEELEAVILHELAHLIRRDDWTKLAQKVAETVFFFHPAVHIIGRQLELERELACDERVVACTGAVDKYARCLTRLVQLTNGSATTLIPGVLANRKQIFRRFERLLLHPPADIAPARSRLRLVGLLVSVCLIAAVAAQLAPAITVPLQPVTYTELSAAMTSDESEAALDRSGLAGETGNDSADNPTEVIGTGYVADGKVHGATRKKSGERTVTITYRSDNTEISADVDGELELTPDNRGIRSLSEDGHFTLIEQKGSDRYELQVTPGEHGDLNYAFTRNNQPSDFDRSARGWFEETLEFFAGETGLGAKGRLRRLLQEGGLYLALKHIRDEVRPDNKRYYYETLVGFDHLGKRDLHRVLDHALNELTEDFDRETVRNQVADRTGESIDDLESQSAAKPGDDFSAEIESELERRHLSRKYTFEGEWEAEFKRNRPWIKIVWFDSRGSQSGFSVPLDALVGIDQAWRSEHADDVRFLFPRDAGLFEFVGLFKRGRGYGNFVFRADEDYIRETKDMGHRWSQLNSRKLYQLALFDVSRDFIRRIEQFGYDDLPLDKLIEMRIHQVKPETVEELRSLGYDLSADRLIEFQIHGVTPWYINDLIDAGLDHLSADRLLEFRIHGVDPEHIHAYADVGLDRLSPQRLLEFRIHGVTPSFVRELADLGYNDLSPDRLTEFRIHGVSAAMVRELHELGYDDLDADYLTKFKIHGVTPSFVRDLAELGYDDISPRQLVTMKIHGVSPSYIRRLQDKGHRDLSVDDLIDMRIFGLD